jgi:EAL domain-containing protein (putative c-di-GMP-specific phosphodiesterase class I)
MKTITEGVETEAQARFLLEHGCDQPQGYGFGRPMPAEAFAEFVGAHRARRVPPDEGCPDAALTG